MKARLTTLVPVLGLLIAASLLGVQRLGAQTAPPGPILPPQSQQQSPEQSPQPVAAKPRPAQLPPRTTLAGPWKLNRDDSDDPRQKVLSAEGSGRSGGNAGGYPGGGYPGGGYPGGGYPGGGYPGGGYPGGGYPGGGYPGGGGGGGRRNSGPDIENNPKMEALLRLSNSLTVELKNNGGAVTSEVDVTDDEFHKLALYTDGRKLPQSTDGNNQQVSAHWNGSQLVSDEKSPLGGKMSRTFELSFDGRELIETLHIDNGKSKTPIVIRYVYNVANSEELTGKDSDPDRPVLKRHSDDTGSSPH